jgi:hypothetical protein
MHFDKKKQEINAFFPFFFAFFSHCLRLFQVFSWLKQKKLQKDEILGAFAPKITSFYTTKLIQVCNDMRKIKGYLKL